MHRNIVADQCVARHRRLEQQHAAITVNEHDG
jgi:hypothetical protein